MQFLMENSNFTIGTVLILQTVGILMGIKPDTFWANQNLYNYESKYITNLVRKTSSGVDDFTTRFDLCIDWFIDLCALNYGGEFGKSFL